MIDATVFHYKMTEELGHGGMGKVYLAESKIRQSKSKFIAPWQIATLYTRAGMPDEALSWFEKAMESRDPNMTYLNIDPIFDYMRGDPRFQALVKKVGLAVENRGGN